MSNPPAIPFNREQQKSSRSRKRHYRTIFLADRQFSLSSQRAVSIGDGQTSAELRTLNHDRNLQRARGPFESPSVFGPSSRLIPYSAPTETVVLQSNLGSFLPQPRYSHHRKTFCHRLQPAGVYLNARIEMATEISCDFYRAGATNSFSSVLTR